MKLTINEKKPELRKPVAAVVQGYIYMPAYDGSGVVCTTNLNSITKRVVLSMKENSFREWCKARPHMTPIYEGDTITIQF